MEIKRVTKNSILISCDYFSCICIDTSLRAAGSFIAKAYPDPASDRFTIEVEPREHAETQVRIFDLSGRILETYEMAFDKTSLQCGKRLASGIYMAEITSGNERRLLKLVKQD